MRAAVLVLVALLSGCVVLDPHSVAVEHLHVSHPSAGPPFGRSDEEDALDLVQAVAEYRWLDRGYSRVGCGVKTRDGGIVGPDVACSIATGFYIRKPGEGRSR